MSWRDGRDSCTCSSTLTGLPAQIPTELRRGSANKTQTVILEVPTCLNSTHSYNPPIVILLLLHYYCYTTLCCMFYPSRALSVGYIILYYILYTRTYASTQTYTPTFVNSHICILLYRINPCERVLCMRTCGHAHARRPYTYINYVYNFGDAGHLAFLQGPNPQSDNPKRLISLSLYTPVQFSIITFLFL